MQVQAAVYACDESRQNSQNRTGNVMVLTDANICHLEGRAASVVQRRHQG